MSRCVPPAPGQHAEVDLGLPELRRLRRDDQVAEHRELAAAAEAEAGDRGDDRRAQVADLVPLVDAPVLVERDRRSGGELGDVGAGRERALAAAEHDRADLRVGVELLQRTDDRAHQLARERVQLLRTVHQHDADAPVALDEH